MRWLLVLGLLLGCGDDDGGGTDAGADAADAAPEDTGVDAFDAAFDADLPIERELAENGEFAIGYATRSVTFERPDGEGTRELELHVWYPAEATEGPRPRYPFRTSDAPHLPMVIVSRSGFPSPAGAWFTGPGRMHLEGKP